MIHLRFLAFLFFLVILTTFVAAADSSTPAKQQQQQQQGGGTRHNKKKQQTQPERDNRSPKRLQQSSSSSWVFTSSTTIKGDSYQHVPNLPPHEEVLMMMATASTTAAVARSSSSSTSTTNGASLPKAAATTTTRRTYSMQLRETSQTGIQNGGAAFELYSDRYQSRERVSATGLTLQKKQKHLWNPKPRGPRLQQSPCNERAEYCASYADQDCPSFLADHGTDTTRATAACGSIRQCEADCASDANSDDGNDKDNDKDNHQNEWDWHLFWKHCYKPECQCQAAREAQNFYAAYSSCGACVPDCRSILGGTQESCSELCSSGCLEQCTTAAPAQSHLFGNDGSSKHSRKVKAQEAVFCVDQCVATSLNTSGRK